MPASSFVARALQLLRTITRPIVRKGWWHWVRFGLLLAAGSYVGSQLATSDRFVDIRYAVYQYQTRLQRRGPIYPQHTVLVLLNDEDFWGPKYESREPVKRDQIAALVDKLNQAGANTVALDLDFFSPIRDRPDFEYEGFLREDAVLKAALKRMCDAGRHVVLATDSEPVNGFDGDGPEVEVPSIYTPWLPELPCVLTGYTDSPSEDLRRIPGLKKLKDGRNLDSFSLAMVKAGDPVAYANIVNSQDTSIQYKGFRFGQFLTQEDFSPKQGRQFVFNGEAIETMDANALRQAVADREVIIGEHWHWLAQGIGSYVDMHATPGGIEPGSMRLANYVEAMRDETGSFIGISDETAEILEWILACCLALLWALEIRTLWKWLCLLLGCFLSLLMSFFLLQNLGLFLDFFIPIVIIVVHTVAEHLMEMRRELQHARQVIKELRS
jgi:hypothetical protein